MAKQQTLKFTIRQDGTVLEEVIGAEAGECLTITESIEKRLGNIETRELKPEYYQKQTQSTEQDVTL